MAQAVKRLRLIQAINVYWVLGVLCVGYGLFALAGYGNDDDTYRMLNTWETLIQDGKYVPSRFQGNLIPELVIGLASELGGALLANLVSVALSIASLGLFYRLLTQITTPAISAKRNSEGIAALSALTIGSNPYWIISSATSMDYIYGGFFFVAGLVLLTKHRLKWAGLLFAAAVCSRLAYGPMGAIAFLVYFSYAQTPEKRRHWLQGLIIFLLASAAFYLPAFFAAGMTLAFLGIGPDASGGFVGIVARFIYKNIYF